MTVSTFRSQFPQIDTIGYPESGHVAVIQGITNATWNIGCFVSAIIAIFLGGILGRKQTIILGLVLMAIGKIIQCSSYSFGQLVAGRFIAGFGNGYLCFHQSSSVCKPSDKALVSTLARFLPGRPSVRRPIAGVLCSWCHPAHVSPLAWHWLTGSISLSPG